MNLQGKYIYLGLGGNMGQLLTLLLTLNSTIALPRLVVEFHGEASYETSLISTLGEYGWIIFPLPSDLKGLEPIEWSRRNQMDVQIIVNVKQEKNKVNVNFEILETASGDLLAKESWDDSIPSERTLVTTFWIKLVREIQENTSRLQKASSRIKALPGTKITGLTENPITVGENGEIKVPLRVPGVYPFRATHPERQPIQSNFAALQNDLGITLEQKIYRTWTIESGLVMGQYPTFGGRFHSVSDAFWFGIEIQQYLLGWILTDEWDDEVNKKRSASFPLLVPNLTFGYYFLENDAVVRPFIITLLGPRIWLPEKGAIKIDPVGTFQLTYALGAEWYVIPPVLFNIQMRVHHYLGKSELFGYAKTKNNFTLLNTPIGLFQLPVLYGGLTWSF